MHCTTATKHDVHHSKKKGQFILLCEFSSVLNNDLFSVWLSSVETVNVSTETFCCICITPYS